jgi:hypothetical protein
MIGNFFMSQGINQRPTIIEIAVIEWDYITCSRFNYFIFYFTEKVQNKFFYSICLYVCVYLCVRACVFVFCLIIWNEKDHFMMKIRSLIYVGRGGNVMNNILYYSYSE